MRGRETRQDDLVTVNEKHGDVFLIFLSKKREEIPFGRGDLENLADRIHTYLSKRIYRMTCSYLRGRPKVSIGYGLVLHNPLIKEERLILKLIEESRGMANFQAYRIEIKNKELLQEIILKEDLSTVFQPIVNMREPSILGYEALTRGPGGTEFESPYMLFDIATESDLLFELDRLCRRKALRSAARLDPEYKLFVNTLPMTIRDPEFHGRAMIEFLEDMKLDPSRIVLEVTERLAIENYTLFLEAMNYFTDIGFAVAVDDMGAGYSGLEKIIHLKPAYLKFDLLMVRDIDTSFVKREMLKAILSLANNVGAHVVAEGVETPEEQETLLELGITYGQGYLFAKAKPDFVGIEAIPVLNDNRGGLSVGSG
jgi:EAL domain-containing protein (putative c-di-GMP-specific phosphodiesterase class I)